MTRAGLAALACAALACGRHQGPGTIEGGPLPADAVAARAWAQQLAVADLDALEGASRASKPILFGDLHAHSTFSLDALARSLPRSGGDGAHPPADACDFARYCAGLDFFALTDRAEDATPDHWREAIESLRDCDARAGDPARPDLVAFLGFEWSQTGRTRDDHHGHRSVVLRGLGDGEIPARPIAAPPGAGGRAIGFRSQLRALLPALLDPAHRAAYADFARALREVRGVDPCPAGADPRELPAACREVAATPRELHAKLDAWGVDALVIPHGTSAGAYTPPGATWERALAAREHDPARETLAEIYSGHGSSEYFPEWRDVTYDSTGAAVCPEPSQDHVPCCWQAGEIARRRCEDPAAPECEARVAEARQAAAAAGARYRQTLPDATLDDWGDCGQCRHCFLPAFDFRPESSVQAALAAAGPPGAEAPDRLRFGFVAASDSHSARPGTGYKPVARLHMTDAAALAGVRWASALYAGDASPDFERESSFLYSGGLVALHASGRDRGSIWSALREGEVYATSGPRILLWFDLMNGARPLPMGTEVELDEAPRFRVRAAGSLEEQPGCPEHALGGLSPERLARLCRDECHFPGQARRRIAQIHVVRIRPQARPGDPASAQIEDPWLALDCPLAPQGCVVEFEDADFAAAPRETVYYARALEEPAQAINAENLRCEVDDELRCVRAHPCYGDARTPPDDDCLAQAENRAWSSPIRVRPLGGG